MRIVIQCASRKHPDARTFLEADGRRVVFVARPDLAPLDSTVIYARSDDPLGDGQSWRRRLVAYNEQATNPLGFLPASRLYSHEAYGALVGRFGQDHVFILSAGWGLIPATFLTPYYDITFSASADPWKRRRATDPYEDFRFLPDDGSETVFLGGRDYLPLFCDLTAALRGRKIVFFNSAQLQDLPEGFTALRYRTNTRTNWHYECARDLVTGRLHSL
jgi:hypothetical protein